MGYHWKEIGDDIIEAGLILNFVLILDIFEVTQSRIEVTFVLS